MRNAILRSVILTATVAAGAVAHDHPDSQSNVVQLPCFAINGAVFITGIGPPPGVELVHATAQITFTSDGTTPASEMLIVVTPQLQGESKHWSFTGADLGFGTAAGTYTATIDTDSLNGLVADGLPGLGSILHIDILATNGGLNGSFKNSHIEVEWNQTLNRVGTEISVAAGGKQGLLLNFGAAYAGRNYVLLGSATGTSPGISTGGGRLYIPQGRPQSLS